MEPLSLTQVAEWTNGELIGGSPEIRVHAVSTDSRVRKADSLFVPIVGPNFDGRRFIDSAVANGSVATLVHGSDIGEFPSGVGVVKTEDSLRAMGRLAFRYRRQFDLPVIAIAGSNGKTTAKEFVAAVLGDPASVVKSPESFNNNIGVPLSIFQLTRNSRYGVFEVGTNHPGELRELVDLLNPSVAVITSIGREHLEFFGSVEQVFEEESVALQALPKSTGLALIDGDSAWADRLEARGPDRRLRVGIEGDRLDYRARRIRLDSAGTQFEVVCANGDSLGEFRIRSLGAKQALNSLFAIAIGREFGIGVDSIRRALAACEGPKWRMRLRDLGGRIALEDCYNANPDSMESSIAALASMSLKGRRIAVLGSMAEIAPPVERAHEEVGALLGTYGIDVGLMIGAHGEALARGARRAGVDRVSVYEDVDAATDGLAKLMSPGDVALVKGSRASGLERVIQRLRGIFGTV